MKTRMNKVRLLAGGMAAIIIDTAKGALDKIIDKGIDKGSPFF